MSSREIRQFTYPIGTPPLSAALNNVPNDSKSLGSTIRKVSSSDVHLGYYCQQCASLNIHPLNSWNSLSCFLLTRVEKYTSPCMRTSMMLFSACKRFHVHLISCLGRTLDESRYLAKSRSGLRLGRRLCFSHVGQIACFFLLDLGSCFVFKTR
jgi:hypothetical protein